MHALCPPMFGWRSALSPLDGVSVQLLERAFPLVRLFRHGLIELALKVGKILQEAHLPHLWTGESRSSDRLLNKFALTQGEGYPLLMPPPLPRQPRPVPWRSHRMDPCSGSGDVPE